MVIPLLAVVLLAPQAVSADRGMTLPDPLTGEESTMLLVKSDRLEPPKRSPRKFDGKTWEYDWVTSGYGLTDRGQELRFRVFSQERKPASDGAEQVARMLLRMWALGRGKLKLDQPIMDRGLRNIDVYLSWGGEAGAEQGVGEDNESGTPRRVNMIYIYDLASFKSPVEMAREIAHEYGHAVLPAVGGFRKPEDWANGHLGERLYLRWMRDAMAAGRLTPQDAMGATQSDLDAWVKKNVDPLLIASATQRPDPKLLGSTGPAAMDAYLGLALYAESLLPAPLFTNALKSTGAAKDLPQALLDATEGASYTIEVPSLLGGKAVWVPLGKSSVQGAKVLSRSGGWAKIQPTSSSVIVLSPEPAS